MIRHAMILLRRSRYIAICVENLSWISIKIPRGCSVNRLCCQVNGTVTCKTCNKKACVDHSYDKHWSTDMSDLLLPMCTDCYKPMREEATLLKKRDGMTFTQLFLAARNLYPKGYMSISVSLDDHNPAFNPIDLVWNVYTAEHGHNSARTPEAALHAFTKKVLGETSEEQIDV